MATVDQMRGAITGRSEGTARAMDDLGPLIAAGPAGARQSRIRLTPEERHRRAVGLATVLDQIEAIPDAPGEDDGDFFRSLDASHPDRPRHGNWY